MQRKFSDVRSAPIKQASPWRSALKQSLALISAQSKFLLMFNEGTQTSR
jgi:hypothetical protein